MSIADSAEAAGAFFELAGTVGGENLLVSRVGALWAWTRRSCCECGYPGEVRGDGEREQRWRHVERNSRNGEVSMRSLGGDEPRTSR